jgi:hypothetical protein
MAQITVKHDEALDIVIAKAVGELTKEDFQNEIEPKIQMIYTKYPTSKGVIIDATEFKGWDGLEDIKAHFDFLKEHDQKFPKIAIIGEASWKNFLPAVQLFLKTDVKTFEKDELTQAQNWVLDRELQKH